MNLPLVGVSRRIARCAGSGETIKASEAYIVHPELIDYVSPTGRSLKIWTRPHYHLNCERKFKCAS